MMTVNLTSTDSSNNNNTLGSSTMRIRLHNSKLQMESKIFLATNKEVINVFMHLLLDYFLAVTNNFQNYLITEF
jgi:hypothetical protein